jgi:TolB-like protein
VVLLLTDRLILRQSEKPALASPIPEKSIAVLPFDNLSRDPENAYFAEGVQDEILTRLAKVADLKVISRTSTQHFQSSPENLPAIAQQLGVAHVLEGSVQKANDKVRVNVQLIKAASDAHLWADTFDRKVTDIFAVESEVAQTIAETLQAKLTVRKRSCSRKSRPRIRRPTSFISKGVFFGTNAPRPICGNRLNTLTPRSPKTPTTRSPTRRWPKPGFVARSKRGRSQRLRALGRGGDHQGTRLGRDFLRRARCAGGAAGQLPIQLFPARPLNSSGRFS